MARTTEKDIRQLVQIMANRTGHSYMVQWAYGRPRIHSGDGSRDVSPRLPTGQLKEWIHGFLTGVDEMKRR